MNNPMIRLVTNVTAAAYVRPEDLDLWVHEAVKHGYKPNGHTPNERLADIVNGYSDTLEALHFQIEDSVWVGVDDAEIPTGFYDHIIDTQEPGDTLRELLEAKPLTPLEQAAAAQGIDLRRRKAPGEQLSLTGEANPTA